MYLIHPVLFKTLVTLKNSLKFTCFLASAEFVLLSSCKKDKKII